LGDEIKLEPDESGTLLWAEYGLESFPMLALASGSEKMVAGARFVEHLNIDLKSRSDGITKDEVPRDDIVA
jgi:hypothetical protein